MPDDEERECVPSKRKMLNWTPLAGLNSLSHHTGFSTSEGFNKEKTIQDWTALELPATRAAYPALANV